MAPKKGAAAVALANTAPARGPGVAANITTGFWLIHGLIDARHPIEGVRPHRRVGAVVLSERDQHPITSSDQVEDPMSRGGDAVGLFAGGAVGLSTDSLTRQISQ